MRKLSPPQSVSQPTFWINCSRGHTFHHRMDRGYLEPGDGLHQNQPRLQALLCGAYVATVARHGYGQVPGRICGAYPPSLFGRTATVEPATFGVCKLHVRPVPPVGAHDIHRSGVRSDEPCLPTYFSSAYQAAGPGRATRSQTALDVEYLAGNEYRVRTLAGAIGKARRNRSPHEVPVARTSARTVAEAAASRGRLDHRRWRIRDRGPGRWKPSGYATSATTACKTEYHSSSSNGAVCSRRKPAGCWMIEPGIKCP